MRMFVYLPLLLLTQLGGCIIQQAINQGPVRAVISYSSAQGAAPLVVTFSAAASTSLNGGPLTYAWDFDDDATAEEVSPTHTFDKPGRYVVRLTVTDPLGERGVATLVVRVQGGGVIAIIAADVSSGLAPLVVQFDGTPSVAIDDTILDYFWDFGDGGTSRSPQPVHVFRFEGNYPVTLRVVSAGGLEASTYTIITVGKQNNSLQFDGGSLATLLLSSTRTMTTCTVEAWVKPESEGGAVLNVGDAAILVELLPATGSARLRVNGILAEATVNGLASSWRHIAVVYNSTVGAPGEPNEPFEPNEPNTPSEPNEPNAPAGSNSTAKTRERTAGGDDPNAAGSNPQTCTLYVDGVAVTSTVATRAISVNRLIVGAGFRGRIAEVRFWAAARSTTDLAANRTHRLTGTQPNLIGYWRFDEGQGQVLTNRVGVPNGTLGATAAAELSDPAWSSDGPALH